MTKSADGTGPFVSAFEFRHSGLLHDCHSDNIADPKTAKVVQINTLKAHGVVVNENGL